MLCGVTFGFVIQESQIQEDIYADGQIQMCKKPYQKYIHKCTYMLIFAVITEAVLGIKGNCTATSYVYLTRCPNRNIRDCTEVNFSLYR